MHINAHSKLGPVSELSDIGTVLDLIYGFAVCCEICEESIQIEGQTTPDVVDAVGFWKSVLNRIELDDKVLPTSV
jgi:hypothetical protein